MSGDHRSKMKGFAASSKQRDKVRDQPCVYCGRTPCDPAHVVDRSLGGCNDPLCVVALCKGPDGCHRAYDEGHLDLLPALEPHYRDELAHGLSHIGLERLRWRVTNERAA